MIRENRQTSDFEFLGGLELEKSPLKISPGRTIAMRNFGVKSGGGYYRVGGYERFDGQEAPSVAEDPDTARAAITAVPGEGGILGVWLFNGVVYAFRNASGGATQVMHKSSGSGWTSVKTGLDPDGRWDFVSYNYYGSSNQVLMLGADGVNEPFQFDGSTYTELTVTGATGAPTHLAAHKNHLFLAYPNGELAQSGIGDPDEWSTGANIIGTGDEIVGLRPLVGGALGIFMRNRISVLYGDNATDWANKDFRVQSELTGAIEWSAQTIGNDEVYLDDRGLTSLAQTQAFGNYRAATFDEPIKRLIQTNKANLVATCISRTRDEFRLFFSHSAGTMCITATFGPSGFEGFGRFIYPFTITCVCSSEDTDGTERIFAGASDGYVYELDTGTSFDGEEIDAYVKLAFNHLGRPRHRKRYRSARFNLESEYDLTLKIKPEFDYGNAEKQGHRVNDGEVEGGGALWGNDNWNEFSWGAQIYPEAHVDITGTALSMSLLISHTSDSVDTFTLYDSTLTYSMRAFSR